MELNVKREGPRSVVYVTGDIDLHSSPELRQTVLELFQKRGQEQLRWGVEVRDQGEPFDPAECETPPPDELRVGGRGVYLIRSVMDEVEYRRDGSTNCVRMRKRHPAHVP